MNTFKPYILSLLALVSAAPVGAMQVEQTKAASSSISQNDLINSIEKEVNALASKFVTDLKNPNRIRIMIADGRLQRYGALLPASMKSLKQVLVNFCVKANVFDKAPSKETFAELMKVAEEIKLHIQKARQINELSIKIGAQASVQAVVSNEQALNQLAQALEADVIKIGTFDVHSQKVPGALKLTAGLKPFKARLTGDLAELQSPLNTYINSATLFDNAKDTESMGLVGIAVELLSENIASLREKLAARAQEKQEPQKEEQLPSTVSVAKSVHVPNRKEQIRELSSDASRSVVNTATPKNQIVAVGRDLGQLGTMPTLKFMKSPLRAGMWNPLGVSNGMYDFNRKVQTVPLRPMAFAHPQQRSAQVQQQRPSVIVEELDKDGNVISSNDATQKQAKKAKSNKSGSLIKITPRRMAVAAAGLTSLGGLGYVAYNYFMPQTASQINPTMGTSVSAPVMQSSMLPDAPLMSTATDVATSLAMGQDVYQWLAGNATNSWS